MNAPSIQRIMKSYSLGTYLAAAGFAILDVATTAIMPEGAFRTAITNSRIWKRGRRRVAQSNACGLWPQSQGRGSHYVWGVIVQRPPPVENKDATSTYDVRSMWSLSYLWVSVLTVIPLFRQEVRRIGRAPSHPNNPPRCCRQGR